MIVPLEVEASKKLGYNLGLKLIRGAYINEELSLAQKHSYESPVFDTILETHETYNNNLKFVIEKIRPHDFLLIATHNLESIGIAKKALQGQNNKQGIVCFAQLKGFSDQITWELACEGYRVFKYLPYGPTDKVIPYLVRRGYESRQVLREQTYQNDYLREEIKRRMRIF